MRRWNLATAVTAAASAALVATGGALYSLQAQQAPAPASTSPPHLTLVEEYCVSCHDDEEKKGGLSLALVSPDVARDAEVWEKIVRKLRARQMPPVGRKERPDEATYDATVRSLETLLDRAAAAHPNPGRTATIRRLTRTEYRNAVRDLLALDVDVDALLPADESSYGFDNVTVGDLSPTLLDRYLSAAEKISRIAVGRPSLSPGGDTIRLPPDLTQEDHLPGLPIGTRGGAVLDYTFPMDGEYEIQVRLMRDRDEHVEGLTEPHDLELLLDKAQVQVFTVKPPQREPEHATVDAAPEGPRSRAGRPARARRRVREEAVAAHRDRASAISGALQLLPPPARPAGHLFDLDRRTLRDEGSGRHAQPAPDIRRGAHSTAQGGHAG